MKYLKITFLIAACALAASAQSPEKFLKNAEKALGGSKALHTAKSVTRTGHVTRVSDGAVGSYSSRTVEPNLYNEDIEVNGFEIETGTNGRSGWSRNSRDGLQSLTGDESIEMRAAAAFRNHLWLERKRERSKLAYAGQSSIDGKAATTVTLTTNRGVVIKIFFDAVTALPLRDEVTLPGIRTETRDYADYRTVGNIKMPFFERIRRKGEVYEVRLDTIEINKAVDPTAFNFPSISKEPLPDIRQLLAELQTNEDRVEALLENYSFTQKIIKRELTKQGVVLETDSETYHMSFYKGNRLKRLIEKNGKPLSEKEQADEDHEISKRVEDIEKRLAKLDGKPDAEDDKRISIAEMLRASNLVNPRRERFRGREVIVFDF